MRSPHYQPRIQRLARKAAALLLMAVLLAGCIQTPQRVPVVPTSTPEPTAAAALGAAETSTSLPATAQPTETTAPRPTFDPSSVKDWGSALLVFDIAERSFGDITYKGIYALNLQDREIRQISPEGYQLLGSTPDMHQILVNEGNALALQDLATLEVSPISDQYFSSSPAGAAWDPAQDTVYFISESGSGTALQAYRPSANTTTAIPALNPISILFAEDGRIVWGQGVCNPFGECTYQSLNWSGSDGEVFASRQLENSILLPCQNGHEFVYAKRDDNDGLSFHIQSLSEGTEIIFWSLNTEYSDCAWSPDQSEVAVTLIDRGWYSGTIQQYHFQFLKPAQSQVVDLSFLPGPMDGIFWAPDGSFLAYTGTSQNQANYEIGLSLLNVEAQEATPLDDLIDFSSENYLAINHIIWLPLQDIGNAPE